MNNEQLITRYVSGLKMVSWVYALIQMMFVFSQLLIPTASTDLGKFGFPTLFLASSLLNGAIALNTKAKNYRPLLFLSIALIIFTNIGVGILNNLDNDPSLVASNIGRIVDYQFAPGIMFITVSVLYLRLTITAFLSALFVVSTAIQQYMNLSLGDVYFSSDLSIVFSSGLAINSQWFVLMCLFVLFTVIVVTVTSWQFDKLTNQASNFERANQVLGRYFSPEVKEEIENSRFSDITAVEKSSLVAVLFTDINGFTKMTENMDPKDVVHLVSEYQSKMVAAIFSSGGTVDKFIGDAVMATFGTPTSRGNDAQNAFECARKMQISMSQWSKERAEKKLPQITHRIGIHFGPCIIGNVGGDQRVEFTVLGDTVNVANRLCDACKKFDSEVIISDAVAKRLSEEIKSDFEANFSIPGRTEKIGIHKLQL